MYCKSCGVTLLPESLYCPMCGLKRFEVSATGVKSQSIAIKKGAHSVPMALFFASLIIIGLFALSNVTDSNSVKTETYDNSESSASSENGLYLLQTESSTITLTDFLSRLNSFDSSALWISQDSSLDLTMFDYKGSYIYQGSERCSFSIFGSPANASDAITEGLWPSIGYLVIGVDDQTGFGSILNAPSQYSPCVASAERVFRTS